MCKRKCLNIVLIMNKLRVIRDQVIGNCSLNIKKKNQTNQDYKNNNGKLIWY